MYLEDTEQVDIMGYKLKDRIDFQEMIFSEINPHLVEQNLKDEKIDYLYFPLPLKPKADLSKTDLEKVFSNSYVEIFKINRGTVLLRKIN